MFAKRLEHIKFGKIRAHSQTDKQKYAIITILASPRAK